MITDHSPLLELVELLLDVLLGLLELGSGHLQVDAGDRILPGRQTGERAHAHLEPSLVAGLKDADDGLLRKRVPCDSGVREGERKVS